MALYTFNELLRPARREGVAVAAINIANYETAVAVYEASEQVQRPVIIQMYSRMFGNGKAEMLIPLLRKLAEKSSQKVAVHLDHGASLEQVRDAIRWGCTSVMFDGSNLPMEENIRITREVVKLAKAAGVRRAPDRPRRGETFCRSNRSGRPRGRNRNGARLL